MVPRNRSHGFHRVNQSINQSIIHSINQSHLLLFSPIEQPKPPQRRFGGDHNPLQMASASSDQGHSHIPPSASPNHREPAAASPHGSSDPIQPKSARRSPHVVQSCSQSENTDGPLLGSDKATSRHRRRRRRCCWCWCCWCWCCLCCCWCCCSNVPRITSPPDAKKKNGMDITISGALDPVPCSHCCCSAGRFYAYQVPGIRQHKSKDAAAAAAAAAATASVERFRPIENRRAIVGRYSQVLFHSLIPRYSCRVGASTSPLSMHDQKRQTHTLLLCQYLLLLLLLLLCQYLLLPCQYTFLPSLKKRSGRELQQRTLWCSHAVIPLRLPCYVLSLLSI